MPSPIVHLLLSLAGLLGGGIATAIAYFEDQQRNATHAMQQGLPPPYPPLRSKKWVWNTGKGGCLVSLVGLVGTITGACRLIS